MPVIPGDYLDQGGQLMQSIIEFFHNLWASISGFLPSLWESVSGFFLSLWASISGFLAPIWASIIEFLAPLWATVSKNVGQFFHTVGEFINTNPYLFAAIIIFIVAIAILILFPLVGFTAVGVAAGSIAAAWQSALGNVAAGSFFACFQSVAATQSVLGIFGPIAFIALVFIAITLMLPTKGSNPDDGSGKGPDAEPGPGEDILGMVTEIVYSDQVKSGLAGAGQQVEKMLGDAGEKVLEIATSPRVLDGVQEVGKKAGNVAEAVTGQWKAWVG